ncbi:hypothetical protein M0R45_004214 [Rubus argutus]|uniref:Pentatricopeptide repeat-containing protein n=1 Tax=Rubus argutus TaxID=59490 RepID=A0AAW1YJ61_RUBAR
MSSSIGHVRRLSTTAQSSISISRAKSKLRSEYDPDKALEIYSSVSEHYSSPTLSRYAQDLAVRRLAKSHRFADIESFIESHKNDPKIKQEPYLSTLIRSYGRAGMFDHALRTYEQMDQLVSYGILIKSFCEAGKPEKAIETLRMMEEKGIEVDVTAYNVKIMYAHVNGSPKMCGMMDEADKVYRGLEANRLNPNAATFRTLVFYLCKNEDFDKAYRVFKKSVEMHKIPDFSTLKFLAEGLMKKKMRKEAKGLIRTVKKKFPPNVVNAWKKVEEGLGLVSELDASCVPHDDAEEDTVSSSGVGEEKRRIGE